MVAERFSNGLNGLLEILAAVASSHKICDVDYYRRDDLFGDGVFKSDRERDEALS